MNKRFSTLLATALVAGGITSVSAAVYLSTPAGPNRDVTKIEEGKAYQLATDVNGATLLSMENNGGVYSTFTQQYNATNFDLAASLWTITSKENMVGGPDFTLTNQLTKMPLAVDLDELTTTLQDVNMGGSVSSWKWLSSTSSPSAYTGKVLVSYFDKDSVVYLSFNGTQLQAAKSHVDQVPTTALTLWPGTAQPFVLEAKDLNTKLGEDPEGDSFQLTADPELSDKLGEDYYSTLGNIFTKNTYRAWNLITARTNVDNFDIHVYGSGITDADTELSGYVMMQVIDDATNDKPFDAKYLVADTAYIEGLSVNNQNFVQFADTATILSQTNVAGTYMTGLRPGRDINSAFFKFIYYPTQDSIAIEVKGYMTENTTTAPVNGKNTVWNVAGTDKTVILNQLTAASEITLGAAPANINFSLGDGTTNRTSKDNGGYVITNEKGQYLAVPIYNTKINGWAAAEWVTVDAAAQDVMRMPAYQWIVVKNDTMTVDAAKVSTITLTNREFANTAKSIQLRQNEGGKYQFSYELGVTSNVDSLTFTPIAASILADEELGYLNLDDEVLDVQTYNFSYFHAYANEDRFIGMMEDSIMNVMNGKLSFSMDKETTPAAYGYTTPYVAGLKQLTRVIYTPYVKTAGGNLYITVDSENRYRLTDKETDAQKFYLKENNYVSEAPYYAFIRLTATDSTKMGSADQDLNVILRDQVLAETRTSAFAVVPNEAPLYRRFNTALDGAVTGEEDAAKILRFKEVYRGEYLMDENNVNFQNEGIAYVGIERADRVAEGAGLSFMVDTAVLNDSPAGEIKPQYFIYVNRVAVEGVDPDPCPEHGYDPNCPHWTPGKSGFEVASYMVSFQDSVTKKVSNYNKLYQWGDYTRVGFVKGLRVDGSDSLYILTNGFDQMAVADLDTAVINKNYKETGVADDYIINLRKLRQDDNHHNYTWSFRYINPEAALTAENNDGLENAFLIESNNYDGRKTQPIRAAWLKSQNGCLVLTDESSTFENAQTGNDDALIFNIEIGSEDDMATDNDEITASEVKVIAGNGQITISGAAGKQVVVSNILGQVVANTVLTSDNATIAAPQGVVVVAVEGEEAVKAIVK